MPTKLARIGGNARPWVEANALGDPEALDVVLRSGIDLHIYPWDVFEQYDFAAPAAAHMAAAADNRAARLAGRILQSDMRRFSLPRAVLGDAGVVACIVDPKCVLQSERLHCACELHGTLTRGMTVFDLRPEVYAPDDPQCKANVTLVSRIDSVRMRALFLDNVLGRDAMTAEQRAEFIKDKENS